MAEVKKTKVDEAAMIQLNKRQKKALSYLGKHEFIGRRTYMSLNSISNKTAFLELK